ncbi:unnamed protein product [Moneuplotes crassus]|uniref:RING-type domain-containing protein n=1 Tax=Euplotes crassus TaxID=5936 RepID=A0AAD1U4M9_EUPCR|nr:unnamed protein product [Moneuplotes crassus]
MSLIIPIVVGSIIFCLIIFGCTCFYIFMKWVNHRHYTHKRRDSITRMHEDEENGNRIRMDDNGEIRIQGIGSSNRSNEPFEYFVVMRPVNGEGERTVAQLQTKKAKPFDPFNRPKGPLENCFMEPPQRAHREMAREDEKGHENSKNNISAISAADRIENLANGDFDFHSSRDRRASHDISNRRRSERLSQDHSNQRLEESKHQPANPGPHLLHNNDLNFEVDEMEQILTNERLYNEILMPNNPPPRSPSSQQNVNNFFSEPPAPLPQPQSNQNSLNRNNPALEMADQARAERKKLKKEKKVNKVLEFTEKGCYDKNFAEFEEKECAICFDEYEQGNDIRKLIKCGHLFHAHCIEDWISATISRKKHRNQHIAPTCPLCKIEIK